MNSYKELIVWKKAVDLSVALYAATANIPKTERFELVSQMHRAAVSIPSNIAEGYGRKSKKEFHYFLKIAYGSCAELETQLEIAQRLSFVDKETFTSLADRLGEIKRMLDAILYKNRVT